MIFSFKNKGKRIYKLIREEKNQFQGFLNENHIEMDLNIELIDEPQQKFRIGIENYKQSNDKGLFKWAGDLHFVRNDVEFTLVNGQLGEVSNLEKIKNQWQRKRLSIISDHSDEKYADIFINGVDEIVKDAVRFSEALRFASPYINLFPGIHGKNYEEEAVLNGYRELPNFLVTKTLPIVTDEQLIRTQDGMYEINVKGNVDEKKYDNKQASTMLRILKNSPRLNTQVQLNYLERHSLDKDFWPEQSLILCVAQIPGTLYREEKTMLKLQ